MPLKSFFHLLCLLAGCFTFTTSEVFYLTTSSKLPCSQQHCFTLAQFLDNVGSNLSSNTTLYFLPGTHSLQSEYMITNVGELHLLSLTDSSSKTATILCLPTAKLSIENVHFAQVSLLSFVGCSKIKIEFVYQLIISNSVFRGLQNSVGTALELIHTNSNIYNSSFLFNSYGSYRGPIRFLQFLIQHGYTTQQSIYARIGGALIVNCSNVSVTGSRFEGNVAEIGGAIFSEGNSDITLTNCILINNRAYSPNALCFGGAIFSESGATYSQSLSAAFTTRASIVLVNTTFLNNTSISEGGAVIGFLIQVKILGCRFTSNSALLAGVLIATRCNVTIYDSYFDLNVAHAVNGGGVMHAYGESTISIIKSHFYNNAAPLGNGGAVLAYSLTNVTIMESVFRNNSAQITGGAVAISQGSRYSLIILRCQFSNNKASEGGVLSADYQSGVVILDSDFNNNTAYVFGGVIGIRGRTHLLIERTSFEDNSAQIGGVLMLHEDTLTFMNDSFFYNNSATVIGGVFDSIQSITQLINCKFINNRAMISGGVAVAEQKSNVTITDCSAYNSTAKFGGVIYMIDYGFMHVENSQFSNCKALEYGGVFTIGHFTKLIIKDGEYDKNTALSGGGVVFVSNYCYLTINTTLFSFNEASHGGVIFSTNQSHIAIRDSRFSGNSANNTGGAIGVVGFSELKLMHTTVINNTANIGGAIKVDVGAIAIIGDSNFIGNTAIFGGTLFLSQSHFIFITNTHISKSLANAGTVFMTGCEVHFTQNVSLTSNFGSVHVISSQLYLQGNTVFENNINVFNKNSDEIDMLKLNEGGAITVFRGSIILQGTTKFSKNFAENGAAMHATNSKIYIKGTAAIVNNTARYNGGGIYFYQSQMECGNHRMCALHLIGNRAFHNGGGMYSVSSTIEIIYQRGFDDHLPSLLLVKNTAQAGGGLYMEANSKLYILKTGYQTNETVASCCSIAFSSNFADYGGAVSVDDRTNIGVCDSNPHQVSSSIRKHANYTECFIQVVDAYLIIHLDYISPSINFSHNYAHYAGSNLFGGLLDRCVASPFAELYVNNVKTTVDKINDGISYFSEISNLLEDTVSSYPVKICFCKADQPDCSYNLPTKQPKKGESFTVALVAVDQVNHTISNTTIHAYLTFDESGFGEGQLIQKTEESCTDLTYSVTSVHDHEKIIVYAEGPCRDSSMSQKWIDIKFIPCYCPIGFQQKDHTENTNCVCICDSALLPYVSSCNAQKETVTKHNDAWISYVNQTLNSSGFLIHDHCPFDYCLSPNSNHKIKVNLNEKNGADAQCAHYRIGTLCGACKHGFSLSLGSSRCIPCSHWHTNLLAILFSALISGIVLVALLLALNLTVAVGTLNGVIFYANIMASNFSTFFPFSSPNVVTVFIAWLNLDIGIDACFFNGMDAYWKVWIDLLFPAYLISLVILIIFISEKSTKFVWLLRRKNPVATLATLILLSYTKLLRTIILSFSFAALKYPDGSVQLMWRPDGTVKYLNGKHIALFVVALIIMIVGVAYTLLLFLWQWILLYQNKFPFKWANDRRLNHFLDPYHAPYVYEHRYWTGLFLLIRAVLYIIAAVNVSNDPGVNLLAIGFVVFSILVLKGSLKKNKIYKNWLLELIEMISYINLAIICLVTFYLLEDKPRQRIMAYTSGSITLALFIIILFYHIIFELTSKLKLWKRSRNQVYGTVTQTDFEENSDTENDQAALITPTSTTVEPPPPGELPLTAFVEAEIQSEQIHSHETEL